MWEGVMIRGRMMRAWRVFLCVGADMDSDRKLQFGLEWPVPCGFGLCVGAALTGRIRVAGVQRNCEAKECAKGHFCWTPLCVGMRLGKSARVKTPGTRPLALAELLLLARRRK
jgi:hypothetical protein